MAFNGYNEKKLLYDLHQKNCENICNHETIGVYLGDYEGNKKFAYILKCDWNDIVKYSWTYTKKGKLEYALRRESGKLVYMHSHIFKLHGIDNGDGAIIDHIDTNGLHNCFENLRAANKQINGLNRGPNKNSKTGYRGVFWNNQRKKYCAKINIGQKQVHIGFFDNPEEAAMAWNDKITSMLGNELPLDSIPLNKVIKK